MSRYFLQARLGSQQNCHRLFYTYQHQLQSFATGVGKYKKGGDSFAAILNVLAKNSDSHVLSTPSILTMDNEESSIIVGQEIPITTGESLGTNNSNPFRTVTRQEIGIKLSVKPQILSLIHI